MTWNTLLYIINWFIHQGWKYPPSHWYNMENQKYYGLNHCMKDSLNIINNRLTFIQLKNNWILSRMCITKYININICLKIHWNNESYFKPFLFMLFWEFGRKNNQKHAVCISQLALVYIIAFYNTKFFQSLSHKSNSWTYHYNIKTYKVWKTYIFQILKK